MEKINDNNFNIKAIEPRESFVLVFISKTCVHCKTVENFLEKLEKNEELVSSTNIFLVEAEKSPKLLEKYQVRSFPTTFFFGEDFKQKHFILGATTVEDFMNGFEKINHKKTESFLKKFFKKRNEKW